MFTSIRKFLRHLPIMNTRGGVMIEFAFAMPMLITLLLGGVELGRYVLLHQKLDRTAMTVSDLVARVTSVTPTDLDTVLNAADLVMAPFELFRQGRGDHFGGEKGNAQRLTQGHLAAKRSGQPERHKPTRG